MKVGFTPGLYTTWEACNAQVHKYPGAKFAKFKTRPEAEAFLRGPVPSSRMGAAPKVSDVAPTPEVKVVLPDAKTALEAKKAPIMGANGPLHLTGAYELWTDGSAQNGVSAGAGYVIVYKGEVINEGGLTITEKPFTAQQAEVYAAVEVCRALHEIIMSKAEPVYESVDLISDSTFVVQTLNEWGPKRSLKGWEGYAYAAEFIDLLNFIKAYRDISASSFTVHHVYAHRGVQHNERADVLAQKYAISPRI